MTPTEQNILIHDFGIVEVTCNVNYVIFTQVSEKMFYQIEHFYFFLHHYHYHQLINLLYSYSVRCKISVETDDGRNLSMFAHSYHIAVLHFGG